MGKSGDVSEATLERVKTLLEHTCKNQKQISNICKISETTVSRIKKKIVDNVILTPNRNKKCGRKKKTTSRMDRRIVKHVINNRSLSCKSIKNDLSTEGIDVSVRTINNRLLKAGLVSRKKLKKPLLTKAMIKKRYSWAKSVSNWSTKKWNKVVIFL